jgi:type IV secretory pathway VirB4 component
MPVYAEYIRPQKGAKTLSDLVPWRQMELPGILLQKWRHGQQRSYRMRGPDLQGRSTAEQGALMLQLNDIIKRLGGDWMVQTEAQRVPVTTLPPVAWRHGIAALIDDEHRARLLAGSFETHYYLTVSWLPPQIDAAHGVRWFMRGPGRPQGSLSLEGAPTLLDFVQQTDYFMRLLAPVLAQCEALTEEETETYLHNCVSDEWYPVGPLASWHDIDTQLCGSTALDPAGWYPQLGDWHLRTCSLRGYPATTLAGMMRSLEALRFPFRWCSRWQGMDPSSTDGILKTLQRAQLDQELTVVDRMGESASHETARVRNTTAVLRAQGVDAMRQELGMDVKGVGEFTSTVTVWDTDSDLAERKRRLVQEVFMRAGFTLHLETRHQTAAWVSSLPGDWRHNVHKAYQDSLFWAHFCPGLTSMWPGPEWDEDLKGGPWFWAQTDVSNLFRVVNHYLHLGMGLVLGHSGAGKSTLFNFMRSMWMQYRGAQATLFDVDKHGRLLTYLLGGEWLDLGSSTLRLQPLRHIDDPRRFALLLQWMLDLCDEGGVPHMHLAHRYLTSGLRRLATRPAHERTFSGLLAVYAEPPAGAYQAFGSSRIKVDGQGVAHLDTTRNALDETQQAVRWALQRYADGGAHGGIFDGTEDPLTAHPVQTFELSDLVKQPRLVGPVMRYIMLEVTNRMSTNAPMFLGMDDFAVPWLVPKRAQEGGSAGFQAMEAQTDTWLQTARKQLVSIFVATHSIQKVLESRIGQLLFESAKLRFYLPMRSALDKHIREVYEELGLTETAIRTIATAPPYSVLVAHEALGQRLIDLQQGPRTLNACARNSAEDHMAMERIMAKEGREGFAPAWYRHVGDEASAQWLEQWQQQHRGGTDDGTTEVWGTDVGGAGAESGMPVTAGAGEYDA